MQESGITLGLGIRGQGSRSLIWQTCLDQEGNADGVDGWDQQLLPRAAHRLLKPWHHVRPSSKRWRPPRLHIHVVVQQGPVGEYEKPSKKLPGQQQNFQLRLIRLLIGQCF